MTNPRCVRRRRPFVPRSSPSSARARHGFQARRCAGASVGSLAPALRYFLRPCPPPFGIAPLPSPTSQLKRGNQSTFQNSGQRFRRAFDGSPFSSFRVPKIDTLLIALNIRFCRCFKIWSAIGFKKTADSNSAKQSLEFLDQRFAPKSDNEQSARQKEFAECARQGMPRTQAEMRRLLENDGDTATATRRPEQTDLAL